MEALHHIAEKDEDGNVLSGDVISIDTRNSYVRASGKLIAVVGMDDVVVVDTDDALLITTRDQAQQVKQIVKKLESIQAPRTCPAHAQPDGLGRSAPRPERSGLRTADDDAPARHHAADCRGYGVASHGDGHLRGRPPENRCRHPAASDR